MLENNNNWFSPSKINVFNSCSMKYKFQYIDKLNKTTSFSLVRGSIVHKIIQKHLTEFFTSGVMIETVSPLEVIKEFIIEIVNRAIYKLKPEGDYGEYSFRKAFNLLLENKAVKSYKQLRADIMAEIAEKFKSPEVFFAQTAAAIPEAFGTLADLIV